MSDKNIPLSELIRIGSRVTTQCHNVYSMDMDTQTTACAIWAAVIAKNGGPASQFAIEELPSVNLKIENPVSKEMGVVVGVVQYLNDFCLWKRERIADWLESKGL